MIVKYFEGEHEFIKFETNDVPGLVSILLNCETITVNTTEYRYLSMKLKQFLGKGILKPTLYVYLERIK